MNPLGEVQREQSPSKSSVVQASSTLSSSYLGEIWHCIEEENYPLACKKLLTFLPSVRISASIEDVRQAYSFLVQIIPHIDTLTPIKLLLDRAEDSLKFFPQCVDEQRQLALVLGRWHFDHAQNPEEKLRAVHYYGKAICIAKKRQPRMEGECHALASQRLMELIRREIISSHTLLTDLKITRQCNATKYEYILGIEKLAHTLKEYFLSDDIDILGQLSGRASDIYNSVQIRTLDPSLEEKEELASFSVLIQKLERQVSSLPAKKEYTTERLTRALKGFREEFENDFKKSFCVPSSNIADFSAVRTFQQRIHRKFLEFFENNFLQPAFDILGPVPCSYDLRAMGSIGRGEVCPFSDLEWMILIQDDKHIDYFRRLVRLVDLQVASLGETLIEDFPFFTCIEERQQSGFHIDKALSYQKRKKRVRPDIRTF